MILRPNGLCRDTLSGKKKRLFFFLEKKNVSYQVSIERLSQDDDFGARMDWMGRPGLGRGLNVRNHLSVGFQCLLGRLAFFLVSHMPTVYHL